MNISSLFPSDSSESASSNASEESFVHSDVLQPETKKDKLANLGYYEAVTRDPQSQQSRTMEILLSGDEDRVKSEYAMRRLGSLSTKPDGSTYYNNMTIHLMAQVLHSHEKLAEARRQIDFLEAVITDENMKVAIKIQTSAEEMIKDSEEMMRTAKKWQIRSYKTKFEEMVQHIEKSKEKIQGLLDGLRGSKKRSSEEMQDTEMSDDTQQGAPKRPKER